MTDQIWNKSNYYASQSCQKISFSQYWCTLIWHRCTEYEQLPPIFTPIHWNIFVLVFPEQVFFIMTAAIEPRSEGNAEHYDQYKLMHNPFSCQNWWYLTPCPEGPQVSERISEREDVHLSMFDVSCVHPETEINCFLTSSHSLILTVM